MLLRVALIIFLLTFSIFTNAQSKFVLVDGAKTDKVKFELVNNLILIPVEVNGVELTFLLDTGVSKPIIFSFPKIDELLKIRHSTKFYIQGLGGGEPIEAVKASYNRMKIGNTQNNNIELFIIYDSSLNFAPRLGRQVHGIIGADFFKDLVVEIKYSSKDLKIHNPENYNPDKCRKCEELKIDLHNDKPYLYGVVELNQSKIPVKLLIDTGGSDALWLFENDSLNLHLNNKKYFEDFLGHGLSGSVYGKRSKVDKFRICDFEFLNANVAFPDSDTFQNSSVVSDRNGSISGNLLKRFNIVFDYNNKKVLIKKNKYFSEKFRYNKSGLELEHSGIRLLQEEVSSSSNTYGVNNQNTSAVKFSLEKKYKLSVKPAYSVVELRKDSPAERAGLKLGDVVINVNGKDTHSIELQDLMAKFYGDEGDLIRLKIERDGKLLNISFRLENLF